MKEKEVHCCQRWLTWALAGSVLLVLSLIFLHIQSQIWGENLLEANNNTWRDFYVYREIGLGRIPLQGPTASIGGHHGYLAYWLFGLWLAVVRSYHGLQLLCALVFLSCLGCSWLIARRVSSRLGAALGSGVFLCSTVIGMTAFPSHIILMPLGTALGFYGLLRASDGAFWTFLSMAGAVLLLGSHRYGLVFLPTLLILDRWFELKLFRSRWIWLLPCLYLLPTIATAFLNRPDLAGQGKGIGMAFAQLEPWLLLRTMPLIHHKAELDSVWQISETLVVLSALLLAWIGERRVGQSAVLAFYAANFVFFLFYKYDGQYYLPMFALLPAVLGMGIDAAFRRSRPAGLALVLALSTVEVHAAIQKTRYVRTLGGADGTFRSVSSELKAIAALDQLRVSETELYGRTWFVPTTSHRRLDYLYHLFSKNAAAPLRDDRCIVVDWETSPPPTKALGSAPAGDLRVDIIGRGETPCASNVLRYKDDRIWYLDLRSGSFLTY